MWVCDRQRSDDEDEKLYSFWRRFSVNCFASSPSAVNQNARTCFLHAFEYSDIDRIIMKLSPMIFIMMMSRSVSIGGAFYLWIRVYKKRQKWRDKSLLNESSYQTLKFEEWTKCSCKMDSSPRLENPLEEVIEILFDWRTPHPHSDDQSTIDQLKSIVSNHH